MNEDTATRDRATIKLTTEQYEQLARSMQWPEDLPQWDKDHDTTPTNFAAYFGSLTTL